MRLRSHFHDLNGKLDRKRATISVNGQIGFVLVSKYHQWSGLNLKRVTKSYPDARRQKKVETSVPFTLSTMGMKCRIYNAVFGQKMMAKIGVHHQTLSIDHV